MTNSKAFSVKKKDLNQRAQKRKLQLEEANLFAEFLREQELMDVAKIPAYHNRIVTELVKL